MGRKPFNALYSDTAGAGDIQATYLDFGPTIFATNSCIVVYVTGNHNLYLFDDNNSALGPITAGTNATLSNSQCTLSGIGGLATLSGNNLTVPFNLTFTGTFAAQQMVFGLAQSFSGTQSPWATLGNWTP